MIHRRIKQSVNRYELDLVRLPCEGCVFEDVDTVVGSSDRVVPLGRRSGHVDKFGGISIQSYAEGSNHMSADGCFRREEESTPLYGSTPHKRIRRWHCYKCPVTDIPSNFGVHHDNAPDHGFLYPVCEMTVSEVHMHATTMFPVGKFQEIGSLNWIFCCNLLQDKEICKDESNLI